MKLKMFVLNCWLLPIPFAINNKGRLNKIISLIKKHNPDIIALQEVWTKMYERALKRNLPEYYFVEPKSRVFNKSGLMTGLKIKHESYKVKYFPRKGLSGAEKLAKKGYHIVKITDDLFFVNTHLLDPTNKKEKEIIKSQFKILEKLAPNKSIIIAGDLNLSEDELKELNERFEHDKSAKLTLPNTNPLTNARFNKRKQKETKVDYVLCSKNHATINTKCIKSPIVSDHYALISNVELK